jgi:hypothetical protein
MAHNENTTWNIVEIPFLDFIWRDFVFYIIKFR